MRKFEYIEHTADIGVKAYGDTIDMAFANAAEAMFALITDNSDIDPAESVRLDIEAMDREGLLVKFLSELIILHESENLVLTDFNVELADNRLAVTMKGERFSDRKHGGGTCVKGVSYHMLEIVEHEAQRPAYVQVLFDI